MEVSKWLVSWFITYLGDLQPTYIGVIIHLLSTMDTLVVNQSFLVRKFEKKRNFRWNFHGVLYSQQSDTDTPEAMLKSCTEQEKDEARELCRKYLGMLPDSDAKMSGSSSKDFDDVQRQRDTRWCFHSKIFSFSSLYFGKDEPNLTTVFFFQMGGDGGDYPPTRKN